MTELGGIASSLIQAGAPVLAQVLGTVLPFPFNVVSKTALLAVASALGCAPEPAVIAATIDADPDAAAAKLSEIEQRIQADMEALKGQVELNKVEASNSNLFVAGWRPAFAWIVLFWMNYNFIALLSHYQPIPADYFNPVWMLFGGMMGLRTVEKWGGVATQVITAIKKKVR